MVMGEYIPVIRKCTEKYGGGMEGRGITNDTANGVKY